MSDLNPSASDASVDVAPTVPNEHIIDLLDDHVPQVREGLPRGYRMRADSHYVDQLDARSAGPTIRLIATRQIECSDPVPAERLDPLSRSIAARGIVQPLLVRRHDGRYKLIAGRKRLAAAMAAGITEVPCLMYDVDDADASALAEAENLRAAAAGAPTGSADADWSRRALAALSKEMSTLASAVALLHGAPANQPHARVALDLVQSQAWRAAWLAHAGAVATGPRRIARSRRIGAIIERVAAGFEPECRLTGLQLDCSIAPNAAALVFDDDLGGVAVTGCILATLACFDGEEARRVEVRADALQPGLLRLEVAQRAVPVLADTVRMFDDPSSARSADLTFTLAALAVKAVAGMYAGTADLMAINGRGGVVRATFHAKPE